MHRRKSPNRLLDLEELKTPFFARTISALESLAEEKIYYLHPSKRWEYPWALEQAQLIPDAPVLDAGCGASVFPLFLAGEGYSVFACDLNFPAGLGKVRGVPVEYTRAALTALPYPDNRFSTVFCLSVIEHLPLSGIPSAMAELRRVLVPGGSLLLTTDFYRHAEAEIWYRGEGKPFRVDWNLFDEDRLMRFIFNAPGFYSDFGIDLTVDWETVSPRMLEFHGYPYTSVAVRLKKV